MFFIEKNPDVDLRKYHTLFLEIGLIVVLLIFLLATKIEIRPAKAEVNVTEEQEVVQMKDIIQTQQQQRPPAPPRPVGGLLSAPRPPRSVLGAGDRSARPATEPDASSSRVGRRRARPAAATTGRPRRSARRSAPRDRRSPPRSHRSPSRSCPPSWRIPRRTSR